MKKVSFVLFASLIALCLVEPLPTRAQEQTNQSPQTNTQPIIPKHRRRHRRKLRRRGIKYHYKHAGTSAGRGGKRFGKNLARGKPIRGGRDFGRGMSGFGKHLGKGTAKVGKKTLKP